MSDETQKSTESKEIQSKPQTEESPFANLERQFQDMEKKFEAMMPAFQWPKLSEWGFPELSKLKGLEVESPKVDIVDRDADVLVRADLPGVKKEDLDISVTDNTLTLKGSTHEEKEEKKGDYFLKETMQGSFSRTLPLPSEVNGEEAKAEYKDGVLEVVIPKVEKAKTRKISVQ